VWTPLADLSGLLPATYEAEMQTLKVQQVQQPFDLAEGPLLRFILLRLSEHKHVLSFVLNHIVADGWSMGVLVRELSAFYQAEIKREAVRVPQLPIQYADYALWQRQWLQGEVLQRQLSYWKQQLAGLLPLELPTDHPRPAIRTYRGALHSQVFPPALLEECIALSQQHGLTLFMLLLTAFKVLLMRYSGQTDLCVGTPIANRTRAEVEGLIGFFINTLVLRTDLSGNPTCEQALRRVQTVCLDAYVHQDIPFEKVVEELSPQRDMSRSPLFQVMFVLQNNDLKSYEPVSGVYIEPQAPVGMEFASVVASKFDLTLTLVQSDQGLHCVLEYSADLFEAQTIQRFLQHWQRVLESMVQNPQARLSDLPVLTPGEQEHLLARGESTTADTPVDVCLHRLVERQVALTPDAIAVVFEEQQLTYLTLNEHATHCMSHLLAKGIGPDRLVGVYMERSLELVIALFAVLKAGGAYLPLDPQLPPARLLALCEDAHLALVLTCTRLKRLLESTPVLSASQILFLCLDERMPSPHHQVCLEPAPENLAYMIYTSGSTGKPKGVMVTHANAVRLFATTNAWFHFQARESWTCFHSAAFDFSVWEIWGCLLYGGRLVVVPYWLSRSPDEFYHLLVAEQVTVLNQTPSAFRQLIGVESRERERRALALRLVIFGGEALDPGSLRPWFAHHADQRPELVNMYGITETTVHVTYRPLAQTDAESHQGSVIGAPLGDLQCYVLDAHRQLVPIGVPGELHVGGAGLARGYWQRADITAERFIPHPFSHKPGARLYCTGDLVRYRATGELEYLGRIDHQVKLRGFRIELGEIEATLMQHPSVREAVVLAREDTPGDKRLVAYVVAEGSQVDIIGEVRTYLQEQLPTYMLPASLMPLNALPLSVNGKVDHTALPVPQTSLEGEQDGELRERTPVEELIAGLSARVLGRTHIGIHDNFFELGGHSLLATQLISRIRTLFQVHIPLRTLFESPTVAQLAGCVKRAIWQKQGLTLPPLRAVSRDQPLPLSFAQQRLWLLDQLEPERAVYTMPITVRLQGRLHISVLQRSVQAIIQRHECLRTVFLSQDGKPLQAPGACVPFALPVLDLRYIEAQQRQKTIVLLAEEETNSPFDLSKGPLIRGKVVLIAEQESVFILSMHHIIADAWSLGVMVHELAAFYEAFIQDKPGPLTPLPVQYADFAVWQRNWLQGEVLEKLLTYWKKQLQGAQPLVLPTDRPASPVPTSHGATCLFSLPTDLLQAAGALSQEEQATLFMTLLAAWQTLIYRYTGQSDSVVGTDIAGRVHEDIEGLIGFFVNLLVLRTDLSGNPSFRELLRRVREMVLQAYTHQDLPFEKLVDALHIERSHRQLPLVRALFVLQNAPLPPLELPGITMQPLNIDPHSAKFDLALFLWEQAHGLSGMINYRTDVFDASTIETLVARFETLLRALVSQPDVAVDTFALFTEEEIQQRAEKDAVEYEDHRRKLKVSRRKEIGLSALQVTEG
jgi:amino acid adenylation domain-containing protein